MTPNFNAKIADWEAVVGRLPTFSKSATRNGLPMNEDERWLQ